MGLELEKISRKLKERYHITEKMYYETMEIDAGTLLTKKRLDLGAKLYYIQCYVNKKGLKLAEDLYRSHMIVMQYQVDEESEFEEKLSRSLKNFQDMILEFQNGAFDTIEYRAVLGEGKEIIDGAHFVACCLYFKKKVPCIYFPELTGEVFDFLFFEKSGMIQGYLELLAGSFAMYRKDCVGRLSVNGQNKYKTIADLEQAMEDAGCHMVYGIKTRCGRDRGWYYIFYSSRKKKIDEEISKKHFEEIKKMLFLEEKEQLQEIFVSKDEKNRWVEARKLRESYAGYMIAIRKLLRLPTKMNDEGYGCLKIKKKK